MLLPEPFGGLIMLAAIAVFFIVGVCITIVGRKSRRRVVSGIFIIITPWILLSLLYLVSPRIDDWNPSLSSDSAAWGTWEGDGYVVELKSDSTYTAQLKDESISGTWKRMDFNVYLSTSDNQERYMRFVEDSGILLLLPDPPRDESPHPGPITKKSPDF